MTNESNHAIALVLVSVGFLIGSSVDRFSNQCRNTKIKAITESITSAF